MKSVPVKDLLRTSVEHIAHQIGISINSVASRSTWSSHSKISMLITGGGHHNSFLVDRIRHQIDSFVDFDSPSELVDFKEALIFAFLGVRRLVGLSNVDRVITGATNDSVSGAVHLAGLSTKGFASKPKLI